jgi:hypothetical protein
VVEVVVEEAVEAMIVCWFEIDCVVVERLAMRQTILWLIWWFVRSI